MTVVFDESQAKVISPDKTYSPENLKQAKVQASQYEVMSDLEKMLEKSMFTDITIETLDGKLQAHRGILAGRSPLFEEILTSLLKPEEPLKIFDFELIVMKEVLRFIYCLKVKNLDMIAPKLIFAAVKFDLYELYKTCVDSIVQNLTTENVVDSLIVAENFENLEFFSKCAEFITT